MKARLLKVVVQPVFVIDDGDTLAEQVAQPIEVSAADWPTFATDQFPDMVDALNKSLGEGPTP